MKMWDPCIHVHSPQSGSWCKTKQMGLLGIVVWYLIPTVDLSNANIRIKHWNVIHYCAGFCLHSGNQGSWCSTDQQGLFNCNCLIPHSGSWHKLQSTNIDPTWRSTTLRDFVVIQLPQTINVIQTRTYCFVSLTETQCLQDLMLCCALNTCTIKMASWLTTIKSKLELPR